MFPHFIQELGDYPHREQSYKRHAHALYTALLAAEELYTLNPALEAFTLTRDEIVARKQVELKYPDNVDHDTQESPRYWLDRIDNPHKLEDFLHWGQKKVANNRPHESRLSIVWHYKGADNSNIVRSL